MREHPARRLVDSYNEYSPRKSAGQPKRRIDRHSGGTKCRTENYFAAASNSVAATRISSTRLGSISSNSGICGPVAAIPAEATA